MAENGAAPSPPGSPAGTIEHRDLKPEYIEHLLSFVDVERLAPITVVADAANGMAGLVVPEIFERLPGKLVPLYMELDGTFPNHPADPIDPENQADLRRAVTEHGADLGLAFDGDADRVFLVDERAEGVSGSLVTALVAAAMLERHPGATILAQPHLLAGGARGHPGARRRAGPNARRAFVHQAGHGRDRRGVRRRALGPLLLPGALQRGLRAGGRAWSSWTRCRRPGVPLSELLAPLRRYATPARSTRRCDDKGGTIERLAAGYRATDGRTGWTA